MTSTFTKETENKFKLKLPIINKENMSNISTGIIHEREIPYLPPEIIENITQQLLNNMNSDSSIIYRNAYYNNEYEVKQHDNSYTLLNLFIVFPYLLQQIKLTLCCSNEIPLHIYNFIYMKIDNVYGKLIMLFENLKDTYNLNMWLSFITCDHSPFYNTNEGVRFVYYILNKYSNHQNKKMSKQLLCNLLNHSDIIPISKNIDNIIFNILVYNFKDTSKLHLSLLTNKEKKLLLSYTLTKVSYRFINTEYDVSKFLISVFKIYSTKLIDILSVNTYFIHIHLLNQDSIIDYILNNYTNDNYLLGSFIKYYLSVVLNYSYSNNLAHSVYATFTKSYVDVISPILKQALIHKHTDLIRLLLNLKDTTKSNILYIIGYNSLFKDKETLLLAIDYIINVYYKHTFNFDDLSLFDWTYNKYDDNNNTLLLKLFLYKNTEVKINNIHNIHNINKSLLYKIYNYMVYHFNRLNINLIFNKSYSFKSNNHDNDNESRNEFSDGSTTTTTVLTYSNSILDKLELLQLKSDINNLYKYITRYYILVSKCAFLMKLMEKQTTDTKINNHIGIDKNESKKYNKKLIYVYNIYNYILKHKLYIEPKLNSTIKRISLINLEEINNSKFNINLIDFNTITTSYKKTSLNRKIVFNMLKLKEYFTKVIEIINN